MTGRVLTFPVFFVKKQKHVLYELENIIKV
jgi:hypothetical protein